VPHNLAPPAQKTTPYSAETEDSIGGRGVLGSDVMLIGI
jgi:hypothetical protein